MSGIRSHLRFTGVPLTLRAGYALPALATSTTNIMQDPDSYAPGLYSDSSEDEWSEGDLRSTITQQTREQLPARFRYRIRSRLDDL